MLYFTDNTTVPALQTCQDLGSIFPDLLGASSSLSSSSVESVFSRPYYEGDHQFVHSFADGSLLMLRLRFTHPSMAGAVFFNQTQSVTVSMTLSGPDSGTVYPLNAALKKVFDKLLETEIIEQAVCKTWNVAMYVILAAFVIDVAVLLIMLAVHFYKRLSAEGNPLPLFRQCWKTNKS